MAADITATDEQDQKLKLDQDKEDKDELKIMNIVLVESLKNVSGNLSEAMQKVSQLTNLVLDNVREIASLKAEILQIKSHTPDRASVPQPVRVAGVDTHENVPQFEDSDWGEDEENVPHFVDYWENSRSESPCRGAQAAAPTEAALDPIPAPAPAPPLRKPPPQTQQTVQCIPMWVSQPPLQPAMMTIMSPVPIKTMLMPRFLR